MLQTGVMTMKNGEANCRNLRGLRSAFGVRMSMAGLLFGMAIVNGHGQTAGSLANGLSAGAVSRGGAMAAESGDVLDAVEGNPAGMAGLRQRTVDVTGVGVFAWGSFRNSVDPDGKMSGVAGALPYGAVGIPLGQKLKQTRWSAALAVTPDELMRTNWQYLDPPGTAGASYGLTKNQSQIIGIRTSAALAWTMGSKWTAGVTTGLVVNSNTLKVPYIFQQQPQLAGLKVLLDLNTRGVGWNGSLGAQWRPSDRLNIGAAWKSMTYVQSFGTADGTASAQFAALGIAANPAFHYRAEVDNQLPQTAALGAAWQVGRRSERRVRWSFEGDWTDWGGAFRTLPVKLTEGTNATINSVAGGNSIVDGVPLHWRDQWIVRTGVELPLRRGWMARGGYSYMSNPVPSTTLTPLTAAILRNRVAAGAGWGGERWHWDAAYEAQLPSSQAVGHSALLAGEYDNSRMQLMAQSVTVSARLTF